MRVDAIVKTHPRGTATNRGETTRLGITLGETY